MLRIASDALTFDDVLLIPAYSTLLPSEVSLETRLTKNIRLNIPLMSSAMDTVTESRLAIAIAQEGGVGIVHKNMSIEMQAREVRAVKNYARGVIRDPITIHPDKTVAELIELTLEHKISGVPVVEGDSLVGIVTGRDVRFEPASVRQGSGPVHVGGNGARWQMHVVVLRHGTSHASQGNIDPSLLMTRTGHAPLSQLGRVMAPHRVLPDPPVSSAVTSEPDAICGTRGTELGSALHLQSRGPSHRR